MATKNKTREFLGNAKKFLNGHTNYVSVLLALENGDLASGGADGKIQIWDINNGTIKKTLTGHTGWIRDLKFVDKNFLISAADDNSNNYADHTLYISKLRNTEKNIKIWDIAKGILLNTLKGHIDSVNSLAVLPNYEFASGSDDKTIKIWNLNTATLKRTLIGHTCDVMKLLVLNNGDLASGSKDNTIRIWDVESGILKKTLTEHTSTVYLLVLLENGDLVSCSTDQNIKIWDVESAIAKRTLSLSFIISLSILHVLENDVFACTNWKGSEILILRLDDGSEKKNLKLNSNVKSIEILKNGELVSGCQDGTIFIWE